MDERQRDGEDAPSPWLALDGDVAVQGLDQVLHQAQPEPDAAETPGHGRVDLIEALEHSVQLVGGNPHALVADPKQE